MSEDIKPKELVGFSLICMDNDYAIRFTINEIQQQLILVPAIDPRSLVESIYKSVILLSDPVGECINEIAY